MAMEMHFHKLISSDNKIDQSLKISHADIITMLVTFQHKYFKVKFTQVFINDMWFQLGHGKNVLCNNLPTVRFDHEFRKLLSGALDSSILTT